MSPSLCSFIFQCRWFLGVCFLIVGCSSQQGFRCGTPHAANLWLAQLLHDCSRGHLDACLVAGGALEKPYSDHYADVAQAERLYQLVCDGGWAEGCYHLCRRLVTTELPERSPESTRRAIERGCALGDGTCCRLGNGEDIPDDIVWSLPPSRVEDVRRSSSTGVDHNMGRPAAPDDIASAEEAPATANGTAGDAAHQRNSRLVQPVNIHPPLVTTVGFAPNSSRLTPSSKDVLDAVAQILIERPEITLLQVEGHATETERILDPLVLSQQRAERGVAALQVRGIARERLRAVGLGTYCPIENDRISARNRRIEFKIVSTTQGPGGAVLGCAAATAAGIDTGHTD